MELVAQYSCKYCHDIGDGSVYGNQPDNTFIKKYTFPDTGFIRGVKDLRELYKWIDALITKKRFGFSPGQCHVKPA